MYRAVGFGDVGLSGPLFLMQTSCLVNHSLPYGAPVNPLKILNLLTHRTLHDTYLGTLEDVGLTVDQGSTPMGRFFVSE